MSHLKGRVPLTIILMIILLLVIAYHIFNGEVSSNSSKQYNRAKLNDDLLNHIVGNNDFQEQHEGKLTDNLKSNDGDYKNEDQKKRELGEGDPLFKGHKIVHFDLKGAPPIISYYRYIFPLLKTLGATGILIEYEDMFPFVGNLSEIPAGNAYSQADIITIQDIAKSNDLIIIPLIQTFGHLEFVLKLKKYKDMREVLRYPQVVCPTHKNTPTVLFNMIDQVVTAHPLIKYLHIGADEVYQIGECDRCIETMAKKQWNKKQLFLDHVTKVGTYIKNKYPHLTVLMWDDEFRQIEPKDILDHGLNKLVQPVVWKYTQNPSLSLTDQLWNNYAQIWKEVWIATAFKGATAPDRFYTDVEYHLQNHQHWLEIVARYSEHIKFRGAILTGWQRYDHFSVLCELLPVALPSLAVNLMILQASDLNSYPIKAPRRVLNSLKCDGDVFLTVPEPQYGWTKCNFLGSAAYSTMLRLFSLLEEITKMEEDNTFKGWLKPYNIKYSFSNPSHVERAVAELDWYKMELNDIEKEMRNAMDGIYDNYTIQEWIETYVFPLNEKIITLWEDKEKILMKESWPKRPLTDSDL